MFVLLFSSQQLRDYLFDAADYLMNLFGNDFLRYAAELGQGSFQFWR